MLNFKSFRSAGCALARIELMHTIRKVQFKTEGGDSMSFADQFYALVQVRLVMAQRLSAAAKEIKALIDDSVGNVELSGKFVSEAGITMNEVVSSVRRVTDIMSEISVASREQESGIEQISRATVAMNSVTQQSAALVEETAAVASFVQEQAAMLAWSRLGEYQILCKRVFV